MCRCYPPYVGHPVAHMQIVHYLNIAGHKTEGHRGRGNGLPVRAATCFILPRSYSFGKTVHSCYIFGAEVTVAAAVRAAVAIALVATVAIVCSPLEGEAPL